jgi:dTDP-4-amino-4,6-dideoxygalactose transaminase
MPNILTKDRRGLAFQNKPIDTIPFSKPYITGFELKYINDVVSSGKPGINGWYTKKCTDHFKMLYNVSSCFLTQSFADAMQMVARLLDIQAGDEIIMPAFTNAHSAADFAERGAKIILVDSHATHPGINEEQLEAIVTERTKVIVVKHCDGIAVDMDKIMQIAVEHDIWVIEDASEAIDAYYKNNALGTVGHIGLMCFHESKNIISGEGGMLMMNDG